MSRLITLTIRLWLATCSAGFIPAGLAQVPATPGAPAWIKPGMRITFYTASAMTAAGEILAPDDNAQEAARRKAQEKANETGKDQEYTYWKDANGQQYSIKDSGGVSGQAYAQVTVAYVDRGTAALDVRLYGIDVGTGAIRAPSATGQAVAAQTGGEYWIHPGQLRQMTETTERGVSVRRVPCRLNGRTYQALQIQVRNNSGYTLRTYDLASGVLLRMSSASSHGGGAWVPDAGGTSHRGGGGTTLAEGWLVGTRELKLPWIGLPAPAWVGQSRELTYAGNQGAVLSGSPAMTVPFTVRLSFRRQGPGWVEFTETSTVISPYGMPPQQSQVDRAAGTSQVGGLWVPPVALARLRPGQVLDRDPVTHVQFSVAAVNGQQVTFLEEGSEYRSEYSYAMSDGILLRTSQQQRVGPATAQLNATLQQRN